MKFISNIWNRIKEPHGMWLVLFYIFSTLLIAGTIVLVVLCPNQTVGHYILYVVAAATLSYLVYTIVIFAPKIKENIIKTLQKNNFTKSLLNDFGYRTLIFSIFSFIINLAYVVFIGTMAILTKSVWYMTIAAYYLVLIFIKGAVFYAKRKDSSQIKQTKTYKLCGIMFLLLTFAFSGVIVLIYTSNMYFEYAGLMIYAVAAYTFFRLTTSIVNIFKARRQEDLYVQSIRNINLASALISLVVLQVALFQAFSPESNTGFANALTGGAISIIILFIGIVMIVKSNRILKAQEKIDER